MNIAFFIKPKQNVEYLVTDWSVKRTLEKMKVSGYTALPVITPEGKYAGTLSEGDLLRFFVDRVQTAEDGSHADGVRIGTLLRPDIYKPVRITADAEELINVALNQNFIPVTDDLGSFIGIVTRKAIIKYLLEKKDLYN